MYLLFEVTVKLHIVKAIWTLLWDVFFQECISLTSGFEIAYIRLGIFLMQILSILFVKYLPF